MKNTFILSALTSVVLVSCGEDTPVKKMPSATDAVPVKVVELSQQSAGNTVSTSGQFTTDDETMLSFKTGGVIQKIYVREGDRVKAGQLLATLNMTEISAQVSQARIALQKAQRDYDRVQNLYNDSVATLEQFQNAGTALELVKQQLTAAEFNAGYSQIRAVSNGVVLKKFSNNGQIVGPGAPVLQTGSAGQSSWMLKVGVSDREWSRIALNDSARVQTAEGKTVFRARVYSKSESADAYTGLFSIELKIENAPKGELASGMFGKAEIYTAQTANVWQIPYEALLDGNADEGFVFATSDKKTAEKVPVKIAAVEKGHVLIAKGLEKHKYLVISGSAYLSDHSPITVKP